MTIIETIVCGLGLIFLVILLCLLLILIGLKVKQVHDQKEWEYKCQHLFGDMNDLIRWCSYEFPITEDIAQWFIKYFQNKSRPSIGDFRDELRSKYKE